MMLPRIVVVVFMFCASVAIATTTSASVVIYDVSIHRDLQSGDYMLHIRETVWNETAIRVLGGLCADFKAHEMSKVDVLRPWRCHGSTSSVYICARGCTDVSDIHIDPVVNLYLVSPNHPARKNVEDGVTPVVSCTSLPAAGCLVVYPSGALFAGKSKHAVPVAYRGTDSEMFTRIQHVQWSPGGHWAYIVGTAAANGAAHIVVFSHRKRRISGVSWAWSPLASDITFVVPLYTNRPHGTVNEQEYDGAEDENAIDTDDTASAKAKAVSKRANTGIVASGTNVTSLIVCVGKTCVSGAPMFDIPEIEIHRAVIASISQPVLAPGVVLVELGDKRVVIGVYDFRSGQIHAKGVLPNVAGPGYVDCSGHMACVYHACGSGTTTNLDTESRMFLHTRVYLQESVQFFAERVLDSIHPAAGVTRTVCTAMGLAAGFGRYPISEVSASDAVGAESRHVEFATELGMTNQGWQLYQPKFASAVIETDGAPREIQALDMTFASSFHEPVYILGAKGASQSIHAFERDPASREHIFWRGFEPVPLLSQWRNASMHEKHWRMADLLAANTDLVDPLEMVRGYDPSKIVDPWDEHAWRNQSYLVWQQMQRDAETTVAGARRVKRRRHPSVSAGTNETVAPGSRILESESTPKFKPKSNLTRDRHALVYALPESCLPGARVLAMDSCGVCGGRGDACTLYDCHVIVRGDDAAYLRLQTHEYHRHTYATFPLVFETITEAIEVCGARHAEIHLWSDVYTETVRVEIHEPRHRSSPAEHVGLRIAGYAPGVVVLGAFHALAVHGRGLVIENIHFVVQSLPGTVPYHAALAYLYIYTDDCIEIVATAITVNDTADGLKTEHANLSAMKIVSEHRESCTDVFRELNVTAIRNRNDKQSRLGSIVAVRPSAVILDAADHVNIESLACMDVHGRTCIHVHSRGGDVTINNISGYDCGTFDVACANITGNGNPWSKESGEDNKDIDTGRVQWEQQVCVKTGVFTGDTPVGVAIHGFHHIDVSHIRHDYSHPSHATVGAGICVSIFSDARDALTANEKAVAEKDANALALARQISFANPDTPTVRIVVHTRVPNRGRGHARIVDAYTMQTSIHACIYGCGQSVDVQLYHDATHYDPYVHGRHNPKHRFTEKSIIYGTLKIRDATHYDPDDIARGRYELVLLHAEWCTELGSSAGAPPQYDASRSKTTGCHSYEARHGPADARSMVRTKKLYNHAMGNPEMALKNSLDVVMGGMKPAPVITTLSPSSQETSHIVSFQIKTESIVTAENGQGLLMFSYDIIDHDTARSSVPITAYETPRIIPTATNPSMITSVPIQATCDPDVGYFRNTAPHQAVPFSQGVCTPWQFDADSTVNVTSNETRVGVFVIFVIIVGGIVLLSIAFTWMQHTAKYSGAHWHAEKQRMDAAEFKKIDAILHDTTKLD